MKKEIIKKFRNDIASDVCRKCQFETIVEYFRVMQFRYKIKLIKKFFPFKNIKSKK